MEVGQSTLAALKHFGLSEYESKAYAGLIELGPATAADLSDLIGVPYSRIYDVLSKLERKGWIETQTARPNRYRAKSPEEAIKLAKREQANTTKKREDSILSELSPLYEKASLEIEKSNIWILRGEGSVLSKAEEMLKRAQKHVMIASAFVQHVHFGELMEGIESAREKDISVRVIAKSELAQLASLLPEIAEKIDNSPIELRYGDVPTAGFLVVDSKEIMFGSTIAASPKDLVGIWTNEKELVSFCEILFDHLWSSSERSN